jgi:hypothetical protein
MLFDFTLEIAFLSSGKIKKIAVYIRVYGRALFGPDFQEDGDEVRVPSIIKL